MGSFLTKMTVHRILNQFRDKCTNSVQFLGSLCFDSVSICDIVTFREKTLVVSDINR
jgi:hypothetical protein